MPGEFSAQRHESLKRLFKNHPNAATRAHRAFLGGISDEAQAYMGENYVDHLAYHPDMEAIRQLPQGEHLAAVKRLHMQESSGPEESGDDTNRDTEMYLGDRAKRTLSHKHTPVERYR